jgi:hypothetical protein
MRNVSGYVALAHWKNTFGGKEFGMCMIFKNVREPLKQIAIWVGIVALLPLTSWYGTAAYRPPPDSEEYNKSTTRFEDKIKDTEGIAEKEKLRNERDQAESTYKDDLHRFHREMFWIAYPIGLAALIFGVFFPVQPVGSGCVFGGLSCIGTGCYTYWDTMDGLHRFVSLIIVLLVLGVLGSWRFWQSRTRPVQGTG